jgi:O-antigen ligase
MIASTPLLLASQRFGWYVVLAGFALGSVNQQLMWCLGIAGVVLLARAGRRSLAHPEVAHFWTLLCLWLVPGAISCLDSLDPSRSATTLLRYLFYGFAGMTLLTLFRAPAPAHLYPFVGAVLLLVIGDGVLQWLVGFNLTGQSLFNDSRYAQRVTGALGLDYGPVLAILSPFAWELARRCGQAHPLSLVVPGGLLIAVYLSGSRASLLLTLIGLGGYTWLLWHKGLLAPRDLARVLVIGAVVALVAAALVFSLSPRWQDSLGVFSWDWQGWNEALSWRPVIWREAWQQFVAHPVNGVGLRAFGEASHDALAVFSALPPKPQGHIPHSAILEVAADLGLIGLLAYLWFLFRLLRWIIRAPIEGAVPALALCLAVFPLASTLSIFSMRIAGLTWGLWALALVMAKTVNETATEAGGDRLGPSTSRGYT